MVVALNGVVSEYFLAEQSRGGIAALEALPGEVENVDVKDADAQALSALASKAEEQRAEREAVLTARLEEVAAQRQQLIEQQRQAESKLDELEAGMNTVERLNFLSRSPEHAKAIAQVGLYEDQLDLLEDERNKTQNGLLLIQREREAAQNPDGASGIMDSVGGTVATLVNPLALDALQEKLSNASDTIMEVMALFVLRTLILPLLFLYCLTVVFKAIWRVDAREWLNRSAARSQEVQHV
ncbi:hypothetical protein ULF88_25760 [Halopseudomonas pachastrellae]|nr:hypothetical protein [Halopseudomonas pachastrellae]